MTIKTVIVMLITKMLQVSSSLIFLLWLVTR